MITLAGRFPVYTRAKLYIVTLILEACDIANVVLELSEREIYNDIRSVTTDTAGFEESYATKEVEQDICSYPPTVGPSSEQNVTVYVESGDTEITWLGITHYSCVGETLTDVTEGECAALGGEWHAKSWGGFCTFGDLSKYMTVEAVSQDSSTFTFKVTNSHADLTLRYTVKVAYRYLAERRLLLRATDATSVAKYGRRVMNLIWQLGQQRNTMQQIIDDYLARYAEPVPILTATIQAKTDRLATFILNAKIDNRLRVRHDGLGIDHDFWINQLTPIHRTDGMLECDFVLEQVRTIEQFILFEWDTSIWDGEHVWAP